MPDRLHQGREDVPAAGRRLLEAPQGGRGDLRVPCLEVGQPVQLALFFGLGGPGQLDFRGRGAVGVGVGEDVDADDRRGPSPQANQQISRLRPVLAPTEPAELRAVCVELVKANKADFIGVGSLQVTAEAGTGITAQDGVAGVEAFDREQVPCAVKALGVADVHDPVPLRLAEGKDLARTPVLGWSEHGDIYLDLGPVRGVRDDPSAHLARQTAEHFRAGRDRVAEADLRRLGVHAAISVPGVPDDVPPEYVPRDANAAKPGIRARVLAAAERGGFVLLVGGSSVGKTRSAVQAVKALLPDLWLVHPDGPAEIAALAQAPSPQMVVWLDELQRYLDGEHGLTGGVVRALLNSPHPAVIIGTLWLDRYAEPV